MEQALFQTCGSDAGRKASSVDRSCSFEKLPHPSSPLRSLEFFTQFPPLDSVLFILFVFRRVPFRTIVMAESVFRQLDELDELESSERSVPRRTRHSFVRPRLPLSQNDGSQQAFSASASIPRESSRLRWDDRTSSTLDEIDTSDNMILDRFGLNFCLVQLRICLLILVRRTTLETTSDRQTLPSSRWSSSVVFAT